MHLDFEAKDLHERTHYVQLTSLPDTCPICHHSVHPKAIATRVLLSGKQCQVSFQCTRHDCQNLFIAAYKQSGQEGPYKQFAYQFSTPVLPKNHEFPDVIRKLSSTFCLIYSQVECAESQQLEQLVGIGLRKALEFLVKDFAINQNPSVIDEVSRTPLGTCIDKFIDDNNVRQCAKRAAWLGNDETHYVRKWENRDIADLKLLVRLTVNWIENYLLTQKYMSEMRPTV